VSTFQSSGFGATLIIGRSSVVPLILLSLWFTSATIIPYRKDIAIGAYPSIMIL